MKIKIAIVAVLVMLVGTGLLISMKRGRTAALHDRLTWFELQIAPASLVPTIEGVMDAIASRGLPVKLQAEAY